MSESLDDQKRRAAQAAAELVASGMVLGLGTGSTAALALAALATRIAGGLRVLGVPSSLETEALAIRLGVPLTTLAEQPTLDLTIDGADEVTPTLDLIKGAGGALLREKVLASASHRVVIVVDSSKLVTRLGSRSPLPVEVVPFAVPVVQQRLRDLELHPIVRVRAGQPALTDNGNGIIDCHTGPIHDPASLSRELLALPGVVDHGLFLGLATTVIVGHGDGSTRAYEPGGTAAW